MLRERSRSTSCHPFHDSSTSSGASNSFAIHAEYKFSVVRFHELRICHMLPDAGCGGGGLLALTAISRVIVPQPAGPPSSVSVTRHAPVAGDATSANQ